MQRWFFLEPEDNERIRSMEHDDTGENLQDEEKSIEGIMKKWTFSCRVLTELRPDETVCVIGNVPELGEWMPEKCVPLSQTCDPQVWSKTMEIPDKKVEYRFCICIIVESGIQVIVRSWETFIQPRVIQKHDMYPKKRPEPCIYGTAVSDRKVDRGWLSKETVVQIKISNDPLTIWRPRYTDRLYYIKITPVSLLRPCSSFPKSMAEALDDSLSADTQDLVELPKFGFVEVASLREAESTFKAQPQFGVPFMKGDMVIYQCTVLFPSTTAFLIDLYTYRTKATSGEPPYHAAFCYVLPSTFTSSVGVLNIPLTSTKQRPLGEIAMEYLIIKPMTNVKCDMSISFARHWNKKRSGLDVGHRGAGNSYTGKLKNCAEIRENTIASMRTAIEHGADYVEFDVQLSKDRVPIIYHDFRVCISLRKKKQLEDTDMLEIPLKELTLEQLQLLKVYHLTEAQTKTQKFYDEDLEDHQPFPTLRQALDVLNPHVGFNIEIKWTMELKDGTYELLHPIDLNEYLDIILEVVMNYAGNRRIIFSCFNPDICTLLCLKQNKYPVMFLTQGETDKWPPYKDLRTRTIPAAAKFACMAELLGVCAHTEDLLKEASLVQLVKEAGLVIWCWGDDNADPDTIKYLKEIGLQGVIYDKIYQYQDESKQESIFLVEARESQKQLIRLAAITSEQTRKTSDAGLKDKVLNVEKARQNMPIMSTATSLASLESHPSDYQKPSS